MSLHVYKNVLLLYNSLFLIIIYRMFFKIPTNKQTSGHNSFSPAKISLMIILGVIFLMAGFTFFIYVRDSKTEILGLRESEQLRINIMKKFINKTINSIKTDLNIVAIHSQFNEYFNTGDKDSLQELSLEYLELSNAKKIYDQIRYINEYGMEEIRINYQDGHALIVDDDDLQDKKNRYYFKDALSLKYGEIFVSPFDLNIENGLIERPIKPMLRFAQPVFDLSGTKKGIVIINYLGQHLLDGMDNFFLREKGQLMMYNQDGYLLKGVDSNDEWSFMYKNTENKTFKKFYPEEWEKIKDIHEGQIITSNGMFTFTKIYPLCDGVKSSTDFIDADCSSFGTIDRDQYYWTIISYMPSSELNDGAQLLLGKILIIDFVLLAIILLITCKLYVSMIDHQKSENITQNLYEFIKVINKIIRHDILGKLTGIRWEFELSGLIDKNKEIKSAYQTVLSGIDLVKQMKQLAESADVNSELKLVQLKPIFTKIASIQKMTVNVSGDATVLADDAIKSVFENLIRNAKIHGGVFVVDVEIKNYDKKVIIKIKDQGCGVDPKASTSVFKEGFTSGETGNTGLGLYIVKKIIERYGGSVRLEKNYPKGCCFVIELMKK